MFHVWNGGSSRFFRNYNPCIASLHYVKSGTAAGFRQQISSRLVDEQMFAEKETELALCHCRCPLLRRHELISWPAGRESGCKRGVLRAYIPV